MTYYERVRDYVQHEDDLINSRLTWSLTIHGFLFATLGILAGKAVDVLIELHKTSTPPQQLKNVVVGLIMLGLIVAVIGALVGYFSRQAIVAAHNAIQHLNAIAHSTGVLRIPPEGTSSQTALVSGTQTVTPDSMEGISAGAGLLVHSVPAVAEIVTVSETNANATNFTATFAKHHAAPVCITPLGEMLIPGIIGGGDIGRHTRAARSYYLILPLGLMVVWI